MKFYLVPAMRDQISEIALHLHNLIALFIKLLSSSRMIRGNFQGRKCRIIDKNKGTNPLNWQGKEEVPRKIQELLLVEGKSTRKEHDDGTLVPTSDVSCSNEQFLSFRTSLESGFTTMGKSLTKAIKDCFTTVVDKLNPRDQDGYNIVIKEVLIQPAIPLWNKRYSFSLFKKGLGFSALNAAETALSCIIQPKTMVGLDNFFRDQVFEKFANPSESIKISNETFGILCL